MQKHCGYQPIASVSLCKSIVSISCKKSIFKFETTTLFSNWSLVVLPKKNCFKARNLMKKLVKFKIVNLHAKFLIPSGKYTEFLIKENF